MVLEKEANRRNSWDTLLTKKLRIDYTIKIENKPVYAIISKTLPGVYKVSFYFGNKQLTTGTIRAPSFKVLISSVNSELEKFFAQVLSE